MHTHEYNQGYYTPKHKDKYVGKGDPYYRSSYEKRIFFFGATIIKMC